MTQEWFESADLEKKSPQTKSEIQPNEPETSETVEIGRASWRERVLCSV